MTRQWGEPIERGSVEYRPGGSYAAQHGRVRLVLGPASGYDCAHCDGTAAQWAWVHGEDRDSVWSYMPLCVSCHTAYDGKSLARLTKVVS